jgi:outer membrane protein assembly factor BamE (lipoprotein component of BamABCDE complex)
MRVRLTFVSLVLLALVGCDSAGPSVTDASASYKNRRDFASLATIHGHLINGMARDEVERLLGEPDYSPTEGQYYYSSDRKEASPDSADRPPATFGLVVDYRDADGDVTDQLQNFTLGPIGE